MPSTCTYLTNGTRITKLCQGRFQSFICLSDNTYKVEQDPCIFFVQEGGSKETIFYPFLSGFRAMTFGIFHGGSPKNSLQSYFFCWGLEYFIYQMTVAYF